MVTYCTCLHTGTITVLSRPAKSPKSTTNSDTIKGSDSDYARKYGSLYASENACCDKVQQLVITGGLHAHVGYGSFVYISLDRAVSAHSSTLP